MKRMWRISALVVISCLCSSLPAPSVAQTVRERLVRAAAGSRDLFGKPAELSDADATMRGMEPVVPEDREAVSPPKYAREPDVAAYTKLRPWSVAYRPPFGAGWPAVHVKEWPAASDAGSLRKLLGDPDGEVRSLAVEALGSLYQPEDVPRIAALLDDHARGAIVLGWSMQSSAMMAPPLAANSVVPERSWHERTVSTYAREALKIMTGHRFDGRYPLQITFTEWWKTHNLGHSALWYWQQRLNREASTRPVLVKAADETEMAFWDRSRTAAKAHQAALHKDTVAELRKQPADVQWKVFLLTVNNSGGGSWDGIGPANSFFPEGLSIPLKPSRLKELIDGANLWSEVADVDGGRGLMLERLALCADQVVRGHAGRMAYKRALAKALEKEDSHSWNRPVLVSRLLLPAPKGRLNDPAYREGYLRKALADENEIIPPEKVGEPRAIAPQIIGYYRERVAAEMVRGNLKARWPVLEDVFCAEKPFAGSDARIGILKALGESPHTGEKTLRLAQLIDDPRNEVLFTQENRRMGMDGYRYYATQSLNSIGGKGYVTPMLLQDLGTPGKSADALVELRRLADALTKRSQKVSNSK